MFTFTISVYFELKGLAQMINENPMELSVGKIITLLQPGFVSDNLLITTKANGLKSAQAQIDSSKVPANVYVPSMLTVKRHARDTTKVLPSKIALDNRPWLMLTLRSDVKINELIELDKIMIDKFIIDYSMSITGVQYRIYKGKLTDETGMVRHGDSVFVRVKSLKMI